MRSHKVQRGSPFRPFHKLCLQSKSLLIFSQSELYCWLLVNPVSVAPSQAGIKDHESKTEELPRLFWHNILKSSQKGKEGKNPKQGGRKIPFRHEVISKELQTVNQISYEFLVNYYLVYRGSKLKSEKGNLEESLQKQNF